MVLESPTEEGRLLKQALPLDSLNASISRADDRGQPVENVWIEVPVSTYIAEVVDATAWPVESGAVSIQQIASGRSRTPAKTRRSAYFS